MKRYLLIVIVLVYVLIRPVFAGDFGMPQSVTILGQALPKQDQSGNTTRGLLFEYFAGEEVLDNLDLIFNVRFVVGKELDPVAQATQMAQKVNSDEIFKPTPDVVVSVDATKKEAVLDFVRPSRSGGMEYAILRYVKVPNGVVSYEISRIIHADNHQDIQQLHQQMIADINQPNLPVPDVAK